MEVGSIRTILTKIYKKLNIEGTNEEKRSILYRLYSREFYELYPTIESIKEEWFDEVEDEIKDRTDNCPS